MTNERTGMIQTVLGLIKPDQLGVTQTHEHLLVDTGAIRAEPTEAVAKRIFHAPMSPEISAYVRHYGYGNLDCSRLDDVDEMIDEVSQYKQYGGQSIVEVTSGGIGRDPIGLARISRATGLNIVMGGSYYVDMAHPPEVDELSEDELMQKIITDITMGANGTDVKTGVIGEVGCSWPLTDNERKVLRASGRAQIATGAPILVHPGRDPMGGAPMQAIGILQEVGVDIRRVILAHLDRSIFSHEGLAELAETGCYLEWDLFGTEVSYYGDMSPMIERPNDTYRMDTIAWAISQGYGDRIVIAQDTFMKHQLIGHGGFGYQYILALIVPRMRSRGFSQEDVDRLLIKNPASVLAFAEPGS